MKKIKFNRFNIIVICVSFALLLFFVASYFDTYSDYIKKDPSKIEGDTVYINDLANDYYYYLGMNYVGDLRSNTVNYQESDLKAVTITYYGYPSNDENLTGYVSLSEQQNKFVYYKYYPIKNNQLTIELIDNPFTLRPVGKGFGGWQSSNGTITKDNLTDTYTLTVNSNTTDIKVYANWVDANVVFLKGEDGDDNFDGSSDYLAVASWQKAFQILRENATDLNDRERNIIVLTGELDHSINYTRPVTHTWSYTYEYTDNETFVEGQEYLIEYKNGNNRYAINDNTNNISTVALTTTAKPSDRSLWIITHDENGYTIKNKVSGNYLGHQLNNNDQPSLLISSTPYYWEYDTNLRTFFKNYELNLMKYSYTLNNTITDGSTYMIADSSSYNNQNNNQSLNILDDSLINTNINNTNYDETKLWRFDRSGEGYTIYNTHEDKYLNYAYVNGNANLVLNTTPLIWNFDSTNSTLSANVNRSIMIYRYNTSGLTEGSLYIGYQEGDDYILLDKSMNFIVQSTSSEPDSSLLWTLTTAGENQFYLKNSDGEYLKNIDGSLSLTTEEEERSIFTLDNNNLYVTQNDTNYYLTNDNETLTTTTNQEVATLLYKVGINEEETTTPLSRANMYLYYDNNTWSLSTVSSPISFVTYERNKKNYYIRFNAGNNNNNFTLGDSTTGTGLYFATYREIREMLDTERGYMANNSYYSNTRNIAVTITSMYDGIDYRDDATLTLTNTGYFRTIAQNDLQMENMRIDSTGYQDIDDASTQTNLRNSNSSLTGNAKNVRIGRGMTPTSWSDNSSVIFTFIQGGTTSTSIGSLTNSNNAYKLVIESGRYSGLMAGRIRNNYGNTTSYYNYYGTIYMTLGSDYDRATNKNDLLDFYYRIGSNNYTGLNGKSDSKDLAYLIDVKSGTYGMNYFSTYEDDPDSASKAYAGIYVGGLTVTAGTRNDDLSSRVIVVEGGNIANINGGLRITSDSGEDGVNTKIYVKNGTIQNIVGGAGVSTTYGDRYISVTGGNIAYSVSGGSNGVSSSDENTQSGRLGGDAYVHIGGEAHIGTKGSGTLYDVSYGSVLGAGNGNIDYKSSGRVDTSHVYISGKAVIEGNVFGGGNFGPVYVDSNVQIDGGTIKGNVYGGSNKNGVGTITIRETSVTEVFYNDDVEIANGQTYLINKPSGTTRHLLSENNNGNTYDVAVGEGTAPTNNSNWIINSSSSGYTIRNAAHEDYLAYTVDNPPTLTMNYNTTNAYWDYDETNKTFFKDIIYTISETVSYSFSTTIVSGNEYVITNSTSNTANSLNSSLRNTRLSTTQEPTDNIWIITASGNGYTVQNKSTGRYLSLTMYGNAATLGTSTEPKIWTWNPNNRRLSAQSTGNPVRTYYLRYSNGWQASTTAGSIYLGSFNVNRVTDEGRYFLVYDNGWKISRNASPLTLSTYRVTNTTGFITSNASNGDVNITMNNGTVEGAIYGGSREVGNIAGTVTMNIKGGDIGHDTNNGSIFGAGYGEDTFVAGGVNLNITDSGDVNVDNTIYGGSALGNVIGNINVNSTDGSGTGKITVEGDFYCGSMGDASNTSTGRIQGNCSLTIDGGTYKGSVYGENNANGSPTGTVTVTTGGNNVTTINKVFGGGNQADSEALNVTVNIENNSNITSAFGGANKASVSETYVNLHGGTVTNIYGGSNEEGDITSTTITTTGGTATNVYGGNNLGGTTTTSNITVDGGNITNLFGGGNEAVTGTSNIDLESGTVTNIYGGGNEAGITTNSNINLNGGTCTTMFGGSNTSGDVPESYINVTGGNCATVYGGNNLGGTTTTSNITIDGGTITDLFGGGNEAATGTSNIDFKNGNVTSVYGGGNKAGITNNSNIDLSGGTCTNMYGGSNTSGDVPVSHIHVTGGTCGTIYGGNNAGGTTAITNVTIDSGTITNVYGGGNSANSITTNVIINNSTNQISNIFGGCKEANATTTNVTLNNGRANNVFGGSNTSGQINTSNVTVNNGTYQNVYGGNNDGGKTINAIVKLLGGTSNTVFGGGNNAETDQAVILIDQASAGTVYGGGNNAAVNSDTSVTIQHGSTITSNVFGGGNYGQVVGNTNVIINSNSDVAGSVYGGGNNALITGNANVSLENAKVHTNVFGGGNFGQVNGSTFVNIKNAEILGSAYAGGNGNTATVNVNTNMVVQGTSKITNHVFGGGNAAQTGSTANDNSLGVVNITGATIGGNVYGGANTSVLYGETVVNIGYDAVTNYMENTNYVRGDISIGGTVFGGGEANASGSEIYDFDFISVTKGIIINIDGNDHTNFDIAGSIFGSGNASSTSGYSRVYINNYGSDNDIKNNVSLQRADVVVLNNAHMALSGATDRTNEYSTVVFSLSRVTELDLKNNSEIYLETGANLLTLFRSLNSDDTLAQVTIDDETHTVTKSTNNRLYMHEDKILNIALNQNVTDYGEVDGMTFFGLFKRDRYGNIVTALYNDDYTTGSTPTQDELYYFSSGSYVLGSHETNHNIKVDGFYTNYEDEDNPGHIYVDYIQPTPEDAEHYMWIVGENIESYDIELVASRYSTLGTYEFPFINHTSGNTTFTILGFNYDTLKPGVSLINPDDVPRVAATGEEADSTMGLAIKPGVGWVNVGSAWFMTNSEKSHDGIVDFKSENSHVTPSFVFYLYHSKNLQNDGSMGTCVISILVVTPIDDLTNKVKRINFNVTISRAIYDSEEYDAAMMPGRQYEMFSSSRMDITAKSSLSAYYSLYMESNQNPYRTGFHRVLTSNIMLPVNTKITMIDFASATKPEYYYYIVNSEDNNALQSYYNEHAEVNYPLSNFIRMGSLDNTNKYNDSVANGIYYDSSGHRVIEEFIFIVDFKDAGVTTDMSNCSLLIELVDTDNQVIRSVLGIQRSNMIYNLHANHEGVITAHANVSKPIVYPGENEDLRVTIDFNQNDDMSLNRIVDTTYYEQKLGIKVSFINELGNIVNGVDLMGTSLTLDGNTYYARSDGTIRFKIADRVVNSYSNIRINTTNSSLAAGEYTIRVDAFYSPDGIYYGMTPADSVDTSFIMMNNSYGLDVTIPEEEIIIDKTTGNNINGNKKMNTSIAYSGLLLDPKIKVALYRRNYNEVYALDYLEVNINDYITNNLTSFGSGTNIYDILDTLNDTNEYVFNFKQNLTSGTYKLEFRLYDGSTYVGNVIKYVMIK